MSMHAERDIISPVLSVRPFFRPMLTACLNECKHY